MDYTLGSEERITGRKAIEVLPLGRRRNAEASMVESEAILLVARELLVLGIVVALLVWVAYRMVQEDRR